MPVDTDDNPPLTSSQLIRDQQADTELVPLSQTSITEEEAQDHPVCYFKRTGVLMCKWRRQMPQLLMTGKLYIRLLFPRTVVSMC